LAARPPTFASSSVSTSATMEISFPFSSFYLASWARSDIHGPFSAHPIESFFSDVKPLDGEARTFRSSMSLFFFLLVQEQALYFLFWSMSTLEEVLDDSLIGIFTSPPQSRTHLPDLASRTVLIEGPEAAPPSPPLGHGIHVGKLFSFFSQGSLQVLHRSLVLPTPLATDTYGSVGWICHQGLVFFFRLDYLFWWVPDYFLPFA